MFSAGIVIVGIRTGALRNHAVNSAGHSLVVIADEHLPANHDLPAVVHAMNALRFGFGFRKCWQQHTGQNGDDGDNDQEFDQRESVVSPPIIMHFHTTASVYAPRFVEIEKS